METTAKIVSNDQVASGIHMMTFEMADCDFKRPGQYAIVEAGGLRRPYPICTYDSNRFTIVFNDNGSESSKLSDLKPGTETKVKTGLGNGFNLESIPGEVYLVADETGIPEMLGMARSLLVLGIKSKLYVSFPDKERIYMLDSFRNLVGEIEVLTEDGSNGREGRASDAVRNADYVFASGSKEMLKDLAGRCKRGQFSFSSCALEKASQSEDCYVETRNGRLSCMQDGPVFDKDIINWD